MDTRTHWENIYATKMPTEVSWYQAHPRLSLELIQHAKIALDAPIIDVGGGASLLAGYLLDAGYRNLTVLDISARALRHAREQLGERAGQIEWIEADVTRVELPREQYALWHDRAVFHFLTESAIRAQYVAQVHSAVQRGGHVIIATFASNGPTHCSGLEVVRYDEPKLLQTLGPDFVLEGTALEAHQTPWHSEQNFSYFNFRLHG